MSTTQKKKKSCLEVHFLPFCLRRFELLRRILTFHSLLLVLQFFQMLQYLTFLTEDRINDNIEDANDDLVEKILANVNDDNVVRLDAVEEGKLCLDSVEIEVMKILIHIIL